MTRRPIVTAFASLALCAVVSSAGVSPAGAQQVLCRFSVNGGTMVLNTNKTGVWTGGPNAGQFANMRGNNTWRVQGETIYADWTIVSDGPMRGRQGTARAPLSSCPAAAGR